MTHGAPDYSNIQKTGLIYRLDDMAELAARLGSVVTYDRRGDVLWVETFEHGLSGVITDTVGVGSAAGLSALQSEYPPFSCYLTAGTTNPSYARVSHNIPTPLSLGIGVVVSVNFYTGNDQLRLTISFYDGTYWYIATLRVDITAQEIYYYDADGDWVLAASNIGDLITYSIFHHIKLIVNLSTLCYVRLHIDDKVYLLTDIPIRRQALTSAKVISIIVVNYNTTGIDTPFYVDNIIVTTSEE